MHKHGVEEIVIVRHGIAVGVGEQGVKRDAERMLSGEGRTRTAAVARGLRAIGCAPDRVLTSPLRRARETAEIIVAGLARRVDIADCPALAPEACAADALHAIADCADATVMVVGHMPNVSELASVLLSGHAELDLPFRKASVCSLQVEDPIVPGGAALNWFLPPAMLRALAEG